MHPRLTLLLIALCAVLFVACSKSPTEPVDSNTVVDIDGHVYRTVTIGNQVWMAENLKVTHYRNGDVILNATDDAVWSDLSATGAFCQYMVSGNSLAPTYGLLYNGYAVADSRSIAPVGWHVATDADWQTLVAYSGGDSIAGGKLKEEDTLHWVSPNVGATNESGFTALPGGNRSAFFWGCRQVSQFWSSTQKVDSIQNWSMSAMNERVVHGTSTKDVALSVRCVKN